jgi:hypothetical protein
MRELDEDSGKSIRDYSAVQQFISVGHWHQLLDPSLGKEIQAQEIKAGQGDGAACGQRVLLNISALPLEGIALPETFELPESALEFIIGDGSAHEAFDRGVRGMRQNGVRHIAVGERVIIPNSDEVKRAYGFALSLQRLEPFLDDPAQFEATRQSVGRGHLADCGDRVAFALTSDEDASIAFEATLTIGNAEYGHGIDRALIGLGVGGETLLRLPPAYLPAALDAFPPPLQEALAQNALVRLQRIFYEAEATQELHEPTEE